MLALVCNLVMMSIPFVGKQNKTKRNETFMPVGSPFGVQVNESDTLLAQALIALAKLGGVPPHLNTNCLPLPPRKVLNFATQVLPRGCHFNSLFAQRLGGSDKACRFPMLT